MLSLTRKSMKKNNKNQTDTQNVNSGNSMFTKRLQNKETANTTAGNHQLNNKYGVSENDVVLAAFPVSNKHWLALTDVCIATGADLILPDAEATIKTLAETIVSKGVTVVAATAKGWRAVYAEVNANPGEISHLRAVLLDDSDKPRFRNCLMLNALSKKKISDVFAAYQKAPWLRRQSNR